MVFFSEEIGPWYVTFKYWFRSKNQYLVVWFSVTFFSTDVYIGYGANVGVNHTEGEQFSLRAAVKKIALDDEKYRPYSTNEATIIGIQNQDSICVNLGLYIIRTK